MTLVRARETFADVSSMTTRGGGANCRDLDWDGCWNVRDFGGLPMAGGGVTRSGRLVRGDSPDRLSSAGWEALWGYGVRTVIDMRRVDECASDVVRPQGLDVHRVSWDDYPDQAWNERNVPPGLPGSMRAASATRSASSKTAPAADAARGAGLTAEAISILEKSRRL